MYRRRQVLTVPGVCLPTRRLAARFCIIIMVCLFFPFLFCAGAGGLTRDSGYTGWLWRWAEEVRVECHWVERGVAGYLRSLVGRVRAV